MADYENNAFFWQKVDTLFLSGKLALTKKKGEAHDTFRNLVYPTDYGHLGDTKSTTEEGVSVYAGSGDRSQITALVVAADILTKETEEEVMAVLRFLNQTDFQKTVLIRRSNVIPSWGISDN